MTVFQAKLGGPGTGKSYWLETNLDANPRFACVTSTTGISALNVGGCTINSLLGYFNTANLVEKVLANSNYLPSMWSAVSKSFDGLAIDEVSMMEGLVLDIIASSIYQFNQKSEKPLNLYVIGDPGQLPVISSNGTEKAFFEGKTWPSFTVDYLTKVYRQENQQFANAINDLRLGNAAEAVDWFLENVTFAKSVDEDFEGSTFFSTNRKVDLYNYQKLQALSGEVVKYESIKKGRQLGEWKSIPDILALKEGALVVLLSNNRKQDYVNGDLARVKKCSPHLVRVQLIRNGEEKIISYTTKKNKYGGQISYLPMRLGWALTVHKCLASHSFITTDKGQIRLSEIEVGDQVLTHKGVYRKVLAKVFTGYKQAYEVVTPYNSIHSSIDHRFRVSFIKEDKHEFLPLGDIDPTEHRLVTKARYKYDAETDYLTSIIRIKKSGLLPMYDLEVEEDHSFVANGFVVHNCQGLTLDRAQVYLGEQFLSRLSGGLMVAVSRVRTQEGLRLVGTKDQFVRACYVEPKYKQFIDSLIGEKRG